MESIYRPRTEGARFDPARTVRAVAQAARRALQTTVATYRRDPWWALWLTLWFPFWIGSVAPPPRWTWKRQASTSSPLEDPAGIYLTTRIDRLTRTFGISWFIGSVLRGIAIGLGAIAIWAVIAAFTAIHLPSLQMAAGLLVLGVVGGVIHGWLVWPNRAQTIRMLDQTFGLRERMVSAFERPLSNTRISRIQLADAANSLDDVLPEIPRSTWIPVREVMLCLLLAGALVTLMLMGVSSTRIAPLNQAPVPQFLLASERMAAREQPVQPPPVSDAPSDAQASIADIQERGRTSQQAREDLGVLGEALAQYPVTKPAADAIANENYAEAADLLRTAAESASTMNQAERDAMADDLDQAADQMSDSNPKLAQATRETAKALREGGPAAEDALNNLATEVEETGSNVESQESLSQELDEATGSSGSSSQSESSSDASDPGDTQQSSQSSSGEQSGAQQGTDPGDGASAKPGVVNQEQQGEQSSSSGDEQSNGSSDEGAGSAASDESEGGSEANEGDGSEGEGSSTSSSQGAPGQSSTDSSSESDTSSASQGSGAGSGNSTTSTTDEPADGAANADSEQLEEAEQPGVGEAGDPPPGDGNSDGSTGTGSTSSGTSSLQLQGTSDESVQSGGDSGTSSTGSGSDSTTASGDLSTSNQGEAGPDSNRVPPSLRDIVRDYFDWPLP